METLKDIFVPYKIAVQLKEIGFDEPCIGYYEKDNPNVRLNEKTGTIKHNSLLIYISAPTWEQVFKWFREKNYQSSIVFNLGGFYVHIEDMHKIKSFTTYGDYTSYEQAREALVLKLIEISGKKG